MDISWRLVLLTPGRRRTREQGYVTWGESELGGVERGRGRGEGAHSVENSSSWGHLNLGLGGSKGGAEGSLGYTHQKLGDALGGARRRREQLAGACRGWRGGGGVMWSRVGGGFVEVRNRNLEGSFSDTRLSPGRHDIFFQSGTWWLLSEQLPCRGQRVRGSVGRAAAS